MHACMHVTALVQHFSLSHGCWAGRKTRRAQLLCGKGGSLRPASAQVPPTNPTLQLRSGDSSNCLLQRDARTGTADVIRKCTHIIAMQPEKVEIAGSRQGSLESTGVLISGDLGRRTSNGGLQDSRVSWGRSSLGPARCAHCAGCRVQILLFSGTNRQTDRARRLHSFNTVLLYRPMVALCLQQAFSTLLQSWVSRKFAVGLAILFPVVVTGRHKYRSVPTYACLAPIIPHKIFSFCSSLLKHTAANSVGHVVSVSHGWHSCATRWLAPIHPAQPATAHLPSIPTLPLSTPLSAPAPCL